MPFVDKHGRFCGFLDIDEDDKKKKFQRRYFILKKSRRLLEWYADSPSVSFMCGFYSYVFNHTLVLFSCL